MERNVNSSSDCLYCWVFRFVFCLLVFDISFATTCTDKEAQKYTKMAEETESNSLGYYFDRRNFEPGLDIEETDQVPMQYVPKRQMDRLTPRRPMSAFFYFCLEERPRVNSEQPAIFPDVDVAKELARRWRTADAESKLTFEVLADQDKDRFDKEMVEYKKEEHHTSSEAAQSLSEDKEEIEQP